MIEIIAAAFVIYCILSCIQGVMIQRVFKKTSQDLNLLVTNGFLEQKKLINQLTESNEKIKEKMDELRFDVRILSAGRFEAPKTLHIPYNKPPGKKRGPKTKEKSPST